VIKLAKSENASAPSVAPPPSKKHTYAGKAPAGNFITRQPAGQVKNNTKQAKQRNAGFDGFLQLERTSFYLSQTWTSIINQFFH
jgi:hypothetical protein